MANENERKRRGNLLGRLIKDAEINNLKSECCIIRISYEHYNSSKKRFDSHILIKVKEIILSPRPGLYLFGELYGKNKID